MNAKQKTLTYVAVSVIALMSFFAAWDLTGGIHHGNVTKYAPIFAPPDLSFWAKRELANSVFWSWLVVGVVYSLLFIAFRETTTDSQKQD